MPIDRFTLDRFELTLPSTVQVTPLGLQNGEYCYKIPVTATPFAILIRSSVDSTGYAAKNGEDSIRCWIVKADDGQPWGSKISKYVTRVAGWESRLLHVLRELWKMCLAIERCPACNGWMKVYRVKKNGPNKGRVFIKCMNPACVGSMKFPLISQGSTNKDNV